MSISIVGNLLHECVLPVKGDNKTFQLGRFRSNEYPDHYFFGTRILNSDGTEYDTSIMGLTSGGYGQADVEKIFNDHITNYKNLTDLYRSSNLDTQLSMINTTIEHLENRVQHLYDTQHS